MSMLECTVYISLCSSVHACTCVFETSTRMNLSGVLASLFVSCLSPPSRVEVARRLQTRYPSSFLPPPPAYGIASTPPPRRIQTSALTATISPVFPHPHLHHSYIPTSFDYICVCQRVCVCVCVCARACVPTIVCDARTNSNRNACAFACVPHEASNDLVVVIVVRGSYCLNTLTMLNNENNSISQLTLIIRTVTDVTDNS